MQHLRVNLCSELVFRLISIRELTIQKLGDLQRQLMIHTWHVILLLYNSR